MVARAGRRAVRRLPSVDVHDAQRRTTGGPAELLTWLVPVLFWLYYLTPLLRPDAERPIALWFLSLVPPAVALAILPLRRRFPIGVALTIGGLLFLAPGVIGAAFAIQASLARRTRSAAVVLLSAGWLIAAKLLELLVGPASGEWSGAHWVELTIAVVGIVVATLIGWLVRSRESESQSRVDADQARHEVELARIERARLAERERIAREMHDVLAHRLSLVSMHAGVLAFRDDLGPEETRETARLIQRNARQSLDELRGVLSTLRGAEAPPEPPQPTLVELAVLIADVGFDQQVELSLDLDPDRVPARISRSAYRIVQEALTNARKHAPGAPVTVSVAGVPGGTLEVRVSNPLADLAIPDRTGSGFGLLGVAERAASVGGSASYGASDGRFTVIASLPWEDEA